MARQIADDILQRTGNALLAGDFPAFEACFLIPQVFETNESRIEVTSRDQLLCMFETVRKHYKSVGVTDMARHVLHATFKDRETITSTHETRLLQNTTLLQAPFPVFSILRRNDKNQWRIAFSSYAPTDDTAAGKAFNAALTASLQAV